MKKLSTLLTILFLTIAEYANAQNVYVSEDFNAGALPTGWTRTQAAGSDGWEFGSPAALSSPAFTIPTQTGNVAGANDDDCNCNASADYLISPSFTITPATPATVKLDAYFGGLTYQGATESAFVRVSTDGGNTWTSVFTIPGNINSWQTYFVDISAYAGQTINVGFHYNDGGGWTYGFGLDNVEIYEPVATDAGVTAVSIPSIHLKNVPLSIEGDLINQGSTSINAIEVYWSDGNTVQKDSITGLNVPSFQTYSFSHSDSLTIATAGINNLQVWTGAINGVLDQNNANDTINFALEIVDTLVKRNSLHEVFTSSSCGPCNPGNANLNTVWVNSNETPIILKYQMSWPGNGDPYYTLEGFTKRQYYGVSGVPTMFVDGGWDGNTNNYTTSLFSEFAAVPSTLDIHSEIRVECKEVTVNITVTPYSDFPGNNRLHVGILEKLTVNNVATNGETIFDNVMKKMLPDGNGTTIGPLVKNVPQTFSFSYAFNGNYILPPNASQPVNHSSNHTIEEFFDLDVVAFVQEHTTKEVFQATYSQDMVGYDIALAKINPITNATVGNSEVISGSFQNWKDSATSSVRISYSVNGGSPVSKTMSNLNLDNKGDEEVFSFLFNNAWTPTVAGNNVIKAWVDNFNSGASIDDSHCNDTLEITVNVAGNTPPTAQFTFSQLGNNTIAFTDASVGATAWMWDFGDGNFSTAQNPTNTYSSLGTYQTCLVASNSNGSDTICQSVNVISGIDDEKENFFNVVPNPSNGVFTVKSDNLINGKIFVMDLTGKIVLEDELNDTNSKTINLKGHKKGIYFIKVIDAKGGYTNKIIIE